MKLLGMDIVCNLRVRENKSNAHNIFRFDFFVLLERLRAGAWRTNDISIGMENLANINFASISNQAMFLDTIKYFQESLASLATRKSLFKKYNCKR